MKRLAIFIIEHRKVILILFTIIMLISAAMIPMVKINYNLSHYLPEDMPTKHGLEMLEQEFGLTGSAQVMIPDISIPKAKELKERMLDIQGIKSVHWLDDVADIRIPLEYLDNSVVEEYYKENSALFHIQLQEGDYSLRSGSTLDEIRNIAGNQASFRGPAVTAKAMRDITSNEIFIIIAFVIPICLIILFLATSSWFEPLLFMAVIGVSVIINMGSNLFFGEISFITQMSGSVLQLAIAMDYSIFLLHRFAEERKEGVEVVDAMRRALHKSFSAITASAMTTVAGFAALMFMRYRLGLDLGLVLAKGILLSLISVLLLLPALAILSNKLIERTKHRSFLPSFIKTGKAIVKMRYMIVFLLIIIIIPAFYAQSSNHFLYGEASVAAGEGTDLSKEENRIRVIFGDYNPVVLLIPSGSIAKETALAEKLKALDRVGNVQSLATIVDSAIARQMLPDNLVKQFETDHYSRMLLSLKTKVEGEEAFSVVEEIRELSESYYGEDYILVGSSVSVKEIKTVVEADYIRTNLISILAVGLILMLTFKSLLLPLILIFVIQASIWINMSIPYFMNSTLNFVGYMIVSAVQLGATIDYAILLTDRFMYNRKHLAKKAAAAKAIADSGRSILTSAGILCTAGFVLGAISSIASIAELGILIGRGALLSSLLVFILLPQLLVIFDKPIHILKLKESLILSISRRLHGKEE